MTRSLRKECIQVCAVRRLCKGRDAVGGAKGRTVAPLSRRCISTRRCKDRHTDCQHRVSFAAQGCVRA
jgi:hypothetical protein